MWEMLEQLAEQIRKEEDRKAWETILGVVKTEERESEDEIARQRDRATGSGRD